MNILNKWQKRSAIQHLRFAGKMLYNRIIRYGYTAYFIFYTKGSEYMSGTELYSLILTTMIAAITFFVKKAFNDLEKKADHSDVEKLETQLADKADSESVRSLERDVAGLRGNIDEIKDNYLTREDFFREQIKTEKKLDKIMDILMELKGGTGNHE